MSASKSKEFLPSFISKEKFSIKDFIAEWNNELSEEISWAENKEFDAQVYADSLNVTKEFIKSIQRNLNIEKFVDKIEINDLAMDKSQSDENQIDPISSSSSSSSASKKNNHESLNRSASRVFGARHSRECDKHDHDKPLALLTVQIFKPDVRIKNRNKLNLDREFQLLSCQSLSILRDSYYCLMDLIHRSDYSQNPFYPTPKQDHHEKIGFFLIDQTFYYDDRNELESFDLICDWATKNMPNCSKRSMTETKFEDLVIQLGYPYLYMHRGNCEHLIVFTDCRLFIPKIEDNIFDYPKLTKTEKVSSIRCQMCRIYFAKWLCLNNKRLPMSPFYFCHNCFITFNYDRDRNKIGAFRAFPILSIS
ncbi:snRNA-activating complex subunit-like protein [Sarcoptes scabiei]|nr:snRNA-activating complex subunit-like protein [Sarcoptes scabiei]